MELCITWIKKRMEVSMYLPNYDIANQFILALSFICFTELNPAVVLCGYRWLLCCADSLVFLQDRKGIIATWAYVAGGMHKG